MERITYSEKIEIEIIKTMGEEPDLVVKGEDFQMSGFGLESWHSMEFEWS